MGCFAIVFEAVPAAVTEVLMPKLERPGDRDRRRPATDGQVLVFHDLLGIYGGHTPKFVKRYAELRERDGRRGRRSYAREVRERALPGAEHIYAIEPEELEAFRALPRPGEPRRRGVRRRLVGDRDLSSAPFR